MRRHRKSAQTHRLSSYLVVASAAISILGAFAWTLSNRGPALSNVSDVSETVTPGPAPPEIATTSGEAEILLAQHLSAIDAKKYGAWWCPHCHAQQALFGQEAFAYINYVECDPEGQNSQTETCRAAGIEGYPTWEVNGEFYSGVQSLQTLATLSNYQGPQDFKN